MSSLLLPQWTVLPQPIVDSQPVNNLSDSSFSESNTEIDELANDEELFPHISSQHSQAKNPRRQSTKRQVKMGFKTSLSFDYKQPVVAISAGLYSTSFCLYKSDVTSFLDKSKPSKLQVEAISPDPESSTVVVEAKPDFVQGSHSTKLTPLKFASHGDFRRSNLFWMTSSPTICKQILSGLLEHRAGKSSVTQVTNHPTVSRDLEQQDVSIVDTIPASSSPKPSFSEGRMVVDMAESVENEKSEGKEVEAAEDAMEVDIPPLPNFNSTANSILGALAAVSIKEPTHSEELPQPPSKPPNSITPAPLIITPTTPTTITAPAAATLNSPSTPPALRVSESSSIPISPSSSTTLTSPTTQASDDIRNEVHAAGLFVPPSRKRPLQDSYWPNNAGDGPSSPKRTKCSASEMTSPSFRKSGNKPRPSTGENSAHCSAGTYGFGEQLADGWKKSIMDLEETIVIVKDNQGKPGLSEAVKRYQHALENARTDIGIIDDSKKLISLWIIQVSNV